MGEGATIGEGGFIGSSDCGPIVGFEVGPGLGVGLPAEVHGGGQHIVFWCWNRTKETILQAGRDRRVQIGKIVHAVGPFSV